MINSRGKRYVPPRALKSELPFSGFDEISTSVDFTEKAVDGDYPETPITQKTKAAIADHYVAMIAAIPEHPECVSQ